jgi:DNA-binding PadR family transcriptional regulator
VDIKTLCLGVLTLGDMTGYQIKKHFEEELSHFFPASYGSIYPALADLARRELVTVRDVAQTKRPDKKVYAITESGRRHLDTGLGATAASHRVRSELFVLLYFAHRLDPAQLAEKLERRLAHVRAVLDAVARFETGPHPQPSRSLVAGLARATLTAQLRFLESNREALLRELARPEPSVSSGATP